MVYISKEYRGQGYAKKMIFHLINEAKDRGFSKCILFSEKKFGKQSLFENRLPL